MDTLAKNCCDAGRAFGPGDSSKLFRRYAREWNSGAFQSSDEFSGKWMDEKFLAVEYRVY
jgi:hypothetical protein